MRNGWRTAFFVLLTINVLVVISVINFLNDQTNKALLEYDISQAVKAYDQGEVQYIDFAAITGFKWDRMYIFGDYTSCEFIKEKMGILWLGCRATGIESRDCGALYVFVNHGWVVQSVSCQRSLLGSNLAMPKSGFRAEQAEFDLDERGQLVWLGGK